MNIRNREEFESLIDEITDQVMATLDARRCPKCKARAVEVVSLSRPTGPTGILRCLNGACSVDMFDPQQPEVIS